MSSSSSSSHPPPSINTLPTDVIQFIFAFIPVKPRLIVVGLVCKRWLNAVYRSITFHRSSMCVSLLSRLPSITFLEIRTAQAAKDLPLIDYSKLTSIHLPHPNPYACYCTVLQKLPAVSSLRLRVLITCHPLLPGLMRSAASLTKLSLHLGYDVSAPLDRFYMPHLCKLRLLMFRHHAEMLQPLLVNHASQLTRISLDNNVLFPVFSSTRFPTLQKLSSYVLKANDTSFIDNMPSLTKLNLRTVLNIDACSTALLPLLTTARVKVIDPQHLLQLTRATNLTHLALQYLAPLEDCLRALLPLASQLQTLETVGNIHGGAKVLELMQQFTSLKRLELVTGYVQVPLVLPRLEALKMNMYELSIDEFTVALNRTLDVAPRVRTLKIFPPTMDEFDTLTSFVERADQAGVIKLVFYLFQTEKIPMLQAKMPHSKWLRVKCL